MKKAGNAKRVEKKKKIVKKPKQDRCGAPDGNQNNLKYTLEIAEEIFYKAYEFLYSRKEIVTEAELMVELQHANIVKQSIYRYLLNVKFVVELSDIKNSIETLLLSRVVKCKDMYPGIAAMVLKNKHGFKDQLDVAQSGEVTIRYDDGTKSIKGNPLR